MSWVWILVQQPKCLFVHTIFIDPMESHGPSDHYRVVIVLSVWIGLFFFFWVLTLHSFIEYFCTIYSENKTIIYDISHSSIAWSIACHSFYSYSMPFSRLTQIIKRKHKGKYQIFLNLPKVWTMGKRGKQQQINDGGNVTLVWEGPEWVHQSGDIGTEQSKNTPKTGISII